MKTPNNWKLKQVTETIRTNDGKVLRVHGLINDNSRALPPEDWPAPKTRSTHVVVVPLSKWERRAVTVAKWLVIAAALYFIGGIVYGLG